jgi:hypothetical protein
MALLPRVNGARVRLFLGLRGNKPAAAVLIRSNGANMQPTEPATGQVVFDQVAIGSNATPILGVVLGILVFVVLALNALAY